MARHPRVPQWCSLVLRVSHSQPQPWGWPTPFCGNFQTPSFPLLHPSEAQGTGSQPRHGRLPPASVVKWVSWSLWAPKRKWDKSPLLLLWLLLFEGLHPFPICRRAQHEGEAGLWLATSWLNSLPPPPASHSEGPSPRLSCPWGPPLAQIIPFPIRWAPLL